MPQLASASPCELRTGRAGHAFDHLGGFSGQSETAIASGANIIYMAGLGGVGYLGEPRHLARRRLNRLRGCRLKRKCRLCEAEALAAC